MNDAAVAERTDALRHDEQTIDAARGEAVLSAPPLLRVLTTSEPRASRRPLPAQHAPALVATFDVAFAVPVVWATSLFASHAGAVLVALAAILAVSMLSGRYRVAEVAVERGALEELPRLLQASTLATLALALWADGVELAPLHANVLVAFWGLLLAALLLGHVASTVAASALVEAERCLVIGDRAERDRLRRHLGTVGDGRLDLAGAIALEDIGRGDDGRMTIEELIAHHRADRVIVLTADDDDRSAQAARRARNAGVRVSVASRVVEPMGPGAHVELVGGSVLLSTGPCELPRGHRIAKRALDIAGAATLLVALAPLLAIVAVAVKATSKGPVLFWQTRVGLLGRRFRIAKFRTMVADAETLKEGLRDRNQTVGLFKIADDPRITRVGRLLRRTSLDELPQLINVLRGDMSLVGPRPLVCDEDELIVGWHRDRLRLKPGMTGPWQILGSARIPLQDMVALDQHYVANRSLWLDVRIMLRTATFVIARKGL
jgi:exopolysaccharide biosynthesis polyprenyl glycosylphosphotransferase